MPTKQETIGPEALRKQKKKSYSDLLNRGPLSQSEIADMNKKSETWRKEQDKPSFASWERKARQDKAAENVAKYGVAVPIATGVTASLAGPAIAKGASVIGRIGSAVASKIKPAAKQIGKEALQSTDNLASSYGSLKSAGFDVASKIAKGIFGLFKKSEKKQSKQKRSQMKTNVRSSQMYSNSQEEDGESDAA